MTDLVTTADNEQGYKRDPTLQARFEEAAGRLLSNDGWNDPEEGGATRLVADLALEGGGVKGIGLAGAVLVLSEAGYTFRGVAGTSAGAIAASLITGITAAGRPMTDLRKYMSSIVFANFMPQGKIHRFLDHLGGEAGELAADATTLLERKGIYTSDYLVQWLGPILHEELGVKTFADLRLSKESDPDLSLPAGHEYRLVVHTSDVTRGQLVRLPWDYPIYGSNADEEDPVEAVRASMSIPFFFEPVTFVARPATVEIPRPGGGTTSLRYAGGEVTWVDGGMLENFPITAFDRIDGQRPRWPTIGIKLSSLQTSFGPTQACQSALAIGIRCLQTMMNEWDTYSIDEATAARTIFVDNAGIKATDFDLTSEQQQTLFLNGVKAATQFVIDMADAGGVPRSPDEAKDALSLRFGAAPELAASLAGTGSGSSAEAERSAPFAPPETLTGGVDEGGRGTGPGPYS